MALTTTQIQNAYVAFFNRPADVAGLTYWSTYAGSSGDLLNTFAQSTEYTSLFANMNNTEIVNKVYTNLFNRSPDVAGLTYWVSQLDAKKVTIGNVADAINKGAQGTDAAIITNKTAAAEAFTKALDTTAEIVAYAGVNATGLASVKAWLNTVTSDAASVTTATGSAMTTVITGVQSSSSSGTTGATFVLTTGVDIADTAGSYRNGGNTLESFKFTSANEVVSASTATLNAGDVMTDGSTTDTDTINAAVTAATDLRSITNIENVNLTTTASTGAAAITWTTASGVKTVAVSGAGTGVIDVTNTSTATGLALASSIDSTGLTGTGSITFSAAGRTGTAATTAITVNAGGQGVSTITTSGGADTITTGLGADVIDGGAGNDTISSGAGNDTITGGSGNDTIDGGTGNNGITAGAGDDSIACNGTTDTLTFGAIGAVGPNGKDTITGFDVGTAAGFDIMNFDALTGGVAAAGGTALTTLTATGNTTATDNMIAVLDRGLAISAENYSTATDFGKIFTAASTAISTTVGGSVQLLLVVQGTDQAQVYEIDSSRDGTATNITTNDIVLVGVLSDVTNATAVNAANFDV